MPLKNFEPRLRNFTQGVLVLFAAVTLLSIAMQNVIYLGLASWLLSSLLAGPRGRGGLKPAPLFLVWGLFLAWALVVSLHAENASHSVFTWRRWLLAVIAWFVGGAVEDRGWLERILKSLLLFSALWCLGAFIQSIAKPILAWQAGLAPADILRAWAGNQGWRAHSGSGGYMILGTGSMMLLAFWAGLALEDRAWRRPIYLWGAVAMGLGLLFTQTRSAWLGLAAGWGLLLAWRKPRWALGALAVVLLAGLALKGSPIMARLHQGVDMGHFATRERVYMAQAGVGIIKDHPLMGVGDSMESWDTPGPDGKSVHMEGYYRRYMSDQARHDPEVGNNEQGHLHDNFIMLTAMLGVPGLLLVLAFFAALVWTALGLVRGADPLARGIGLGYIAVVAAWWTNGVFEFNFCSAQSSATLWFLTGLLLAAVRLAKGKTTPA